MEALLRLGDLLASGSFWRKVQGRSWISSGFRVQVFLFYVSSEFRVQFLFLLYFYVPDLGSPHVKSATIPPPGIEEYLGFRCRT